MGNKANCLFAITIAACCIVAITYVDRLAAGSTRSTYADSEGYAVLSVLLDRFKPRVTDMILEISPLTVSEDQALSSLSCTKIPGEFQSAAKDFREKNKVSLHLAARFSMEAKYELAENRDKFLPPKPKPGEQELTEPSAVPLYVVSAVGFDPSRTRAIAYVSIFCGKECGGGAHHFVIKGKEGWKEIPDSPKCEWISQNQHSDNSRRGS